ncbi:MAG: NAD(P)-dependent oxidoreductase [Lachnospiraceae bacterium]
MEKKIFIYSCREDEKELLEEYARKWNLTLGYCAAQPVPDNAHLCAGYPCVSMVGTRLSDETLLKFHELGVKLISTRSVGTEHINGAYAKELGIQVANISYSPNSVADFAIMLMLMSLRKAKYILEHYKVRDYSLGQNQGRELRNMKVGILGAGHIGSTVIREISGFGCEILVYGRHEREEIKKYATYASLDEIYKSCDLLSFHLPATPETYHMIHCENVMQLKKGVVIINTSRGSLVDNKALIKGIEAGVISAAGLDVIDHEPVLYNLNHKDALPTDQDLAVLESFPNVIITPHTAFYTDQAVRDMIENTLYNCLHFLELAVEYK